MSTEFGTNKQVELQDVLKIGENDYGYAFGVGRLNDYWIGFAVGYVADREPMMFVLPNIGDGVQLGLADRDQVIKLTAATAQYPSHGYGGITRWFIDEPLRVIDPKEYVCFECDSVGCTEDHSLEEDYDQD